MKKLRISFIGAGRVASALGLKFNETGYPVIKVVSVTRENGQRLAAILNASWSDDLEFRDDTDLILVAVTDDSLRSVLEKVKCSDETIVAHTAGSLGIDIFPGHIARKGIFYPLQTFSHDRRPDFRGIPFFIESPDKEVSDILSGLAMSIGGTVHFADSLHRRYLHVAAVFASNFTNYMLTAGKTIAGKAGFDFSVLGPLVNETVMKAFENGPENSQTGPAIRNDRKTIEKHIDLLSFSPEFQKTYTEITGAIISFYLKGTDDKF
ncbi:MAG: Rossmann-like and DUF2520 domain-containing protein [Bacteroidales bacterium]